tara:strand:+ start:815 stop:1174 length:360 start_codon:yes stop_codon:yes gene_type:complete
MATQQKKTGRDYPLSPTPEPMRTDNTSVSKVNYKKEDIYPTASFGYKHDNVDNYTKKDSADYREGYKSALKTVTENPEGKGTIGGKYEKGFRWVGLNDAYNAGFSEGKDRVLDKKSKKK